MKDNLIEQIIAYEMKVSLELLETIKVIEPLFYIRLLKTNI